MNYIQLMKTEFKLRVTIPLRIFIAMLSFMVLFGHLFSSDHEYCSQIQIACNRMYHAQCIFIY